MRTDGFKMGRASQRLPTRPPGPDGEPGPGTGSSGASRYAFSRDVGVPMASLCAIKVARGGGRHGATAAGRGTTGRVLADRGPRGPGGGRRGADADLLGRRSFLRNRLPPGSPRPGPGRPPGLHRRPARAGSRAGHSTDRTQARIDALDAAGTSRGFAGPAILATATPCASSGPSARIAVSLIGDAKGDVVACQADNGPTVVLADLRPRRARFSFSEDGVRWRESWRATPDLLDRTRPPREQGVYVRLATDDGRIEVIERAASGRPDRTPAAGAPDAPSGTPQL